MKIFGHDTDRLVGIKFKYQTCYMEILIFMPLQIQDHIFQKSFCKRNSAAGPRNYEL